MSYDDVFVGRILYEASFYGDMLEQLTMTGLPLLASQYHLSQERASDVESKYQEWATGISSDRTNKQHIGRLLAAILLTVNVLIKHHPVLSVLCANGYNKQFVSALVGLDGALTGPTDTMLPPFQEFLRRFVLAADFYTNLHVSSSDNSSLPTDRLCKQHGLAWMADQDLLEQGFLSSSSLSSTEAVNALSPHLVEIIKSGLNEYVDVKLGFTSSSDIAQSDDDITPISVKKIDLNFDSHHSMLVSIRSLSLSSFCKQIPSPCLQ